MNTKKPILILFAVLLLAGVFTSFNATTVHAAKWTLNLDASSLSAVDSTITASGTQTHGFRIGAVLTNASFTGNALTVYGWQFQITYNATAFIPQGDPNTLATPGNPTGLYTDSATNTVLYGATTSPTTCPSWNSRLTAGTAFGTNSISTSGSVGQIQVAFTMLGTNPAPVVSAASCIFANVQFEIINPVTTPQTFTISNVVFVDNTGANIPGVVPGAPVTETITDVPPIARVVATGLPSGSSACVPVTGAVCSADAVQFDGTSSSGAISAAAGTAGFFWDFGDPAAACGVTTNDDCDGFYSGSTFSGGITCTNGNLATFGCQGGVAIHDYGVPGTFNVTLRVQDTAGNTGSARDTLGNVILNNQPSHTQLLNFAVPIVSQAHPTTTNITCSPGSVQVSQSSSCTATVTDTSASGATTPTGTVDFTTNSTATFTPAPSCTLAAGATAGTATCSVTYTPGASASGHHLITGNYAGDSSHTTSSGTFLLAVTPAPPHPTTTSVACSPGSVQVSTATTCTVTVTDTSSSPTTPTGTVSFTTNSTGTFTPAASCTLAGTAGTSTCSVTYTPGASAVGHHLITGNYVGDSTHTSSSGTFLLAVTPAPPHTTTTAVSCSPSSVPDNSATTCTATVTDTNASPTTPTGSVSFTTNSTGTFTPSASCTLAAGATQGTATCSVTYTPTVVGHHLITGNYAADSTHTSSSGSFNLASTQRTTTTTVACTPSPVTGGSATSCTATVTDSTAAGTPVTPTGTVSFTTNSTGTFTPSASCTLVAGTGTASCSVTYTPGSTAVGHHLITGTYPGDATHTTSNGSFNLAVTAVPPHPTTTTVQCSPASVQVSTPTSCTVTVTDTSSSPTTPTGTVSFTSNSTGTFTPATSCTLAAGAMAGTATCSVTYTPGASATGHHLITGNYAGDSTHTTSSGTFLLAVTPAPPHTTTTTVDCTPSSVADNSASTCTATVTDTNASPTTPTGTVTFTTNSTGTFNPAAGTCTLAAGATAGTATCSVSYTPTVVGHHLITGNYPGDSTHTSSSGSFNLASTQRTTTTTVACTPAPVTTGSSTSCTATVSDSTATGTVITPTGTVSFTTNSTGTFSPATSCTLAASATAGTASCSVTYTPGITGHHLITGSYPGGTIFTASQGSYNLAVVTAPPHSTTIAVTCSPGSVQVSTPTTCTATVTDTSSSPTTPTGSASFTTNSTGTFAPASGTCTLVAGATADTATCSLCYTPTVGGHHMITGSYGGDSTHSSSQGSFVLAVTAPPHSTTTTLTCSPGTVQVGTPSTCTATVTDIDASPTTPTGTVSFTTNSTGTFTPSTSCTLAAGPTAGTASCSVTYTPDATAVGHHLITGSYSGDSTHTSSSGSFNLDATSVPPPPPHSTSTTVDCSPASVQAGSATSCTATVTDTSSSPTTPTGTVNFTTNSTGNFTPSPSCTLAPGATADTATCTVTYTPTVVGHHLITGNYAGDSTHDTSSGSFTLEVTTVPPHSTTTSVSCSPGSVQAGTPTTCTATVTDTSASGATTPTGTVSFTTNATGTFTPGNSCTLAEIITGTASCSVTYTPGVSAAGNHIITGNYAGDSTHNSRPGRFTLAVTAAPRHATTTTVSCSPSPTQVNSTASCTATVTDTNSTPTTPTGAVVFGTNSTGTFAPTSASCTLAAGATVGAASCSVSYTPNVAGHHLINANYTGDSSHTSSTGQFNLATTSVTPTTHPTQTRVSCGPGSVPVNTPTTCTARVMDKSLTPTIPTGTVSFTTNDTGTFTPSATCTLTPGPGSSMATCTVTFTPTHAGRQLITANYGGDSTHSASRDTFSVNVRGKGQTLLTFNGFDLDDYDNSVGQLQVVVNGQQVVDIPAGLNQLTGTGDFSAYEARTLKFGPFDISSYLVTGQNTILFQDQNPADHFGIVSRITITQDNTLLLSAPKARGVGGHSSFSYTFSNPPLAASSFSALNPDGQTVGTAPQETTLNFATTYTGGTGPFSCTFSFGDGQRTTVTGTNGACSASHNYDYSRTFNVRVKVRGSSTSDLITTSLNIAVT